MSDFTAYHNTNLAWETIPGNLGDDVPDQVWGRHANAQDGIDPVFVAGMVTAAAFTTLAISSDLIYAVPFIAPKRGATVSDYAFWVSAFDVGAVARVAIYGAVSANSMYPGTLQSDLGEIGVGSTGEKNAPGSPAVALGPGLLYWAAIMSDGTPTLRALDGTAGMARCVGVETVQGAPAPMIGVTVVRAYGNFPISFPGGGSLRLYSDDIPAVAFSLSV